MEMLTTTVYSNYTVFLFVLILNMLPPSGIHTSLKILANLKVFKSLCLKQWDLGYQDLLDLFQLPTLENRRLYLKLCTLYEILLGYFYFLSNVFVPQVNGQSYSLPLIHQSRAHTNAFQSSFVPSSVSVSTHSKFHQFF